MRKLTAAELSDSWNRGRRACADAGYPLPSAVTIEFNPRFKTTAGDAAWPTKKIRINPLLSFDELFATVLHEAAHILARVYYDAGGHGKEWKHCYSKIAIAAGIDPTPERCHSDPQLKEVSKKGKLKYGCLNTTCGNYPSVFYKTRRFNASRYRCKACQGHIGVRS